MGVSWQYAWYNRYVLVLDGARGFNGITSCNSRNICRLHVCSCLINSGSVFNADGFIGCEICGVCGCCVGTTGRVGSVLSDIRSGNGVVALTLSDEVGLL